MDTKIRVIAAVVTKEELILYKESGGTYRIPQGDHRLQQIVDLATPLLIAGQVVEVSLISEKPNPYKDYEEQSGKVVRFFRMAKTKFSELFTKAETQEEEVKVQAVSGVLGARTVVHTPLYIPTAPPVGGMFITPQEPISNPAPPLAPMVSERATAMKAAVAEIVANAVPASAPGFSDLSPKEGASQSEDTIVAVVGNQVVAGVEKIEHQITRSVNLGTTKAMDAFMRRVAAVASERQHSADDLLKFLEKADLPIAEDGCIVIYKALKREISDSKQYRDIHTGRVPQRVGDYVCMDPKLVDHNRRVECSNGLHVGRRDYMGSFSGDVMVLAKVKPEDVIAVPQHDPNKMRVCGYHILFELSPEAADRVRNRQPFTSNEEAQKLLGACLAGQHTAILRHVTITKHNGGGIVINDLTKGTTKPTSEKVSQEPIKAEVLDIDHEPTKAPALNPKLVAQTVVEAKAETRAEKGARLYQAYIKATKANKREAAQEVFTFKKQAKVGWERVGLTPNQGAEIEKALAEDK
jgi:hypothetical protein